MEGNTIPLYDRVKNQIYEDFQRLKRQQTILMTVRSKRKKVLALKEFRSKYLRFFFEIYSLTNFDSLPKEIKSNLLYFSEDIERINNKGKVYEVILNSTIAIRKLQITKITFDRDGDSF